MFRHLSSHVFSGMMSAGEDETSVRAGTLDGGGGVEPAGAGHGGAGHATPPASADGGHPPSITVDTPSRHLPLLRQGSSDLQARVGAMLFGQKGPGLVGLQGQLFAMMSEEIERETAARTPSVGRSAAAASADADAADLHSDAYCFELVSIVLSLSDSAVGQSKIATPYFMSVLFRLLPVGTPRVQRQVRCECCCPSWVPPPPPPHSSMGAGVWFAVAFPGVCVSPLPTCALPRSHVDHPHLSSCVATSRTCVARLRHCGAPGCTPVLAYQFPALGRAKPARHDHLVCRAPQGSRQRRGVFVALLRQQPVPADSWTCREAAGVDACHHAAIRPHGCVVPRGVSSAASAVTVTVSRRRQHREA